jgi:hypothetical protein
MTMANLLTGRRREGKEAEAIKANVINNLVTIQDPTDENYSTALEYLQNASPTIVMPAIQQTVPSEDQKAIRNLIGVNPKKIRLKEAEGGSMLTPPEMGMEEEMPVDTFTPEVQANAEKEQLPDDQMEEDYMGYIIDQSLDTGEQEYLMNALEADSQLSNIFDKIVMTASEFSGAGEVEGPGTGVSDSIPARLSDGEFVMTEAATSEIGADNLQTMMDDAERRFSGGEMRSTYQMGGLLGTPPEQQKMLEEEEENLINQTMLGANQMPSLMGGRR